MKNSCPKCGATMEQGFTTADGLIGGDRAETELSQLIFVVPGAATPSNPIKAFKQGISDEPAARRYRISGVRCSRCGFLEFYGDGERG